MEKAQTLRILYVGWVGFGNLGDDVCRDLFIDHVRESAAARGRECQIRTTTHQGISEEALLAFRPHLVVLGAGSLFTLPYLQPLLLAQKHGIPTATWGTGFDKLPGPLLDQLLSGETSLSVWPSEHEAATVRRAVDACAWAGVRGPHTLTVLQSAGCASPRLHICGDPGLLIEAPGEAAAAWEPAEPALPSWLGAEAPVVGVNWGTANNQVYGADERGVALKLRQVIDRLLSAGYRVLLFPVWGPDVGPLRRLAAPFEGNPNVFVFPRVPRGPQLAWILKQCRFTINFKLHANVFSAAAGRPFISLAYRSKCYDFAASLGCGHLVVRFSEPELVDAVLSRCAAIERGLPEITGQVRAKRRQYVPRLKRLIQSFAAAGLD